MVDTFYLHLDFFGQNGWSVNLPFVCNKCGNCCKLEDFLSAGKINGAPEDYPSIYATLEDLFGELGKILDLGEAKYDEFLLRNDCPFLRSDSCSIYEVRPEGCRLFPKTAFGMESEDCEPLIRFKRMQFALRKGRKCVGKCYFMQVIPGLPESGKAIAPVKFTERQFQSCLAKLRQVGVTDDELVVFGFLNGQEIV